MSQKFKIMVIKAWRKDIIIQHYTEPARSSIAMSDRPTVYWPFFFPY